MDLLSRLVSASAGGASTIDPSWDIDYLVYNGLPFNELKINAQDSVPEGIFLKPDGTKMYMVGTSQNALYEYSLSTPWELGSASYVQRVVSLTSPVGVFFKPDGTKMYILSQSTASIQGYSLSTAWDISTATTSGSSFSVGSQDAIPGDLYIKDDGTKFYIVGAEFDAAYEYSMSTSWDISTGSYDQSFTLAANNSNPEGIFFKPDGTEMYVCSYGYFLEPIMSYTLSTAWDISTAVFSKQFNLYSLAGDPSGVFFKSDGTEMFITSQLQDTIYKFNLSTAWDVSSSAYLRPSTDYFFVGSEDTNPYGIFLKPDGTKMYITGDSGNDINEYDLSTPWQVETASYLQRFSISAQDSSPRSVWFKDDGTTMFVVGDSTNRVHQYTLSTAWDISTAVYDTFVSIGFTTSPVEGTPQAIYFQPDGLAFYITGATNDKVYKYTLSSAWDFTRSVSHNTTYVFSTSPEGNPTALAFKSDGTKMYIAGTFSNTIREYDLSTPWDITTASYSKAFDMSAEVQSVSGMFFKDDGLKLFTINRSTDAVWSYDLES